MCLPLIDTRCDCEHGFFIAAAANMDCAAAMFLLTALFHRISWHCYHVGLCSRLCRCIYEHECRISCCYVRQRTSEANERISAVRQAGIANVKKYHFGDRHCVTGVYYIDTTTMGTELKIRHFLPDPVRRGYPSPHPTQYSNSIQPSLAYTPWLQFAPLVVAVVIHCTTLVFTTRIVRRYELVREPFSYTYYGPVRQMHIVSYY